EFEERLAVRLHLVVFQDLLVRVGRVRLDGLRRGIVLERFLGDDVGRGAGLEVVSGPLGKPEVEEQDRGGGEQQGNGSSTHGKPPSARSGPATSILPWSRSSRGGRFSGVLQKTASTPPGEWSEPGGLTPKARSTRLGE